MLYEEYTAEDFLLDDSFQKYCLGSDEEAVHFWKEWIMLHPQKKEETEQGKELYFILNGNVTAEEFAAHKEKFSSNINALIDAQSENKTQYPAVSKTITRQLFSKKKVAVSAAASVIIIIGAILYTQNKNREISAQHAIASRQDERKVIELSDGSKVILNAKSTIQLDRGFGNKSRELNLSGEAFFDVAHDASKPFIIHTPYVDVKVLGTVFNVKAYPDEKFSETSLLKGSVELTLKKAHNKKIILKPNEKISINYTADDNTASEQAVTRFNLGISKTHVSQSNIFQDSALATLIWNKGNMMFDNSSFEDIAMQLQQRFGTTISFTDEAIKRYRFTGDFSDKTVIQILNALQLSRSFNYEAGDSTHITISK